MNRAIGQTFANRYVLNVRMEIWDYGHSNTNYS